MTDLIERAEEALERDNELIAMAYSMDLARLAVAAGELVKLVQDEADADGGSPAMYEALARFRAIAEGKE